ncbi:histamine N-methyltransferase A-like [Synchiropus splendidus]|uniref:histamine N-methyltransferase A-like n=1 Tax=Synchiropus splendidus TaxID=270530 RepID=UPI00237D5CA2|nr:histamine N-methyltransferase A-like [Synchiropus splendidus]
MSIIIRESAWRVSSQRGSCSRPFAAFSSILCPGLKCKPVVEGCQLPFVWESSARDPFSRTMEDDDDPKTCYDGAQVQSLNFYLEKSGEHEAIRDVMQEVLPPVIKWFTSHNVYESILPLLYVQQISTQPAVDLRTGDNGALSLMAEGKNNLDILGIGSGGAAAFAYFIRIHEISAPTNRTREINGPLLETFSHLVTKHSWPTEKFVHNTVTSSVHCYSRSRSEKHCFAIVPISSGGRVISISRTMEDDDDLKTCYDGAEVQRLNFYLEKSGEHDALRDVMQDVLPPVIKRMAEGKNNLDILGIGSGGGQVDIHILNLLQELCPGVSLSTDIVEGSCELVENFKERVKTTPSLKDVPFTWHVMSSEAYVKQERAKAEIKKFDFIHMVEMIYYVEDLEETLKFYRSVLKPNGRIMIVLEADKGGWDTLYNTFTKEISISPLKEHRFTRHIAASLKKLGMKFEEHDVPGTVDITDCFDSTNETGKRLLNFLTYCDDFQSDFSPELQERILDVIRNKCSTEKDGKIFFHDESSMLLTDAEINEGRTHMF